MCAILNSYSGTLREKMFFFFLIVCDAAVPSQTHLHGGLTHLNALRVDLLALLVPADPRLGVARRLAHEGDHTPRDANLVDRNFCESWRRWFGTRERKRAIR